MGPYGYYLVSAVFLIVYMAISWFTVGLLHLSGPAETLARMVLMGIGLTVFGLVMTARARRQQRGEKKEGAAVAVAAGQQDIDTLVREAEARLAASPLGREAKLSGLPLIYLLGEPGAAKTSLFVHSGAEADLLAGQVYQDHLVVPTRPLNVWLANRTLFVEPGGAMLADGGRWIHLVRRLQPARLRSLFARRREAPRAAIVCISCETFIKANSDDTLSATARYLHTRLGELAQATGMSLPVYVIFTKLDRLLNFTDYVGNLTDQESTQVVGVTLPLDSGTPQGVYAEEAARRLTTAFDTLVDALAQKRMPFLNREHDAAKLPHVYEFPRDFRKLRNLVVRLLVDLGRPSQLRANPFLRGFYFTGVRPVTVKETVEIARQETPGDIAMDNGMAGIFDDLPASPPEQAARPAQTVRTRRVPQWLFLGHLFSDVVLADRAAMGAVGVSSGRALARRLMAAAAAVLCLGWAIGMTVSYFRNRALAARCETAARGIAGTESGGAAQGLPSLAALQRLDSLRQSVELLSRYEREGAPWGLRWGLYIGHDIYPGVRRIYFNRFHHLMFGATQASLLEWMRKLPAKPGPNDEYKPTYDTLKAYLITTSHHEKSTQSFLPPFLMERWSAGRDLGPERAALARAQFDFYAEELRHANPFSSENDGEAIERARFYLAQFNATESIYQFMLSEAARQKPAVNFNKQYPGSAAYVVNGRDVSGAFSLDGWKFMQEAINNVKRFFGGEIWVLGERAYANLDPAKIAPELRARYHRDFLANWRAYLANSEVVRYRGVADAAQKLGQLSSNGSFLLALICVASVHTSVPDEDAKLVYQPVQYVTPPSCPDRFVQGANAAYVSALVNLQASVERVAKNTGPGKEELVSQASNDATNALKVTRQIAQNFRIDREGNVHGMVQKLMEDPIRYVEGVLGRLGPAELNAEGKRFCGQFLELTHKYPFNTGSRVDATLDEINGIFRPGDGKLATFFESNLRNYIERRGSQYVRKADSRVQVTDAFLRFFNRATAFSEALYKGGAKEPSLTYTMKVLPAEGLAGVRLDLDGQTLRGTSAGGESKDFTWPGTGAHAARLAGNMGAGEFSFITYDGLWAAFRFFGDADRFQASGAGYTLQWVPRQGQSSQPIRLDSGKALTLPFFLDLKGAPPIFQKGYLSGFECVSEVAR